jgi:hypothetical protein
MSIGYTIVAPNAPAKPAKVVGHNQDNEVTFTNPLGQSYRLSAINLGVMTLTRWKF